MSGLKLSRMTRRSAIGAALGTAALAVTIPGLAHQSRRKPNFLFMMADDLGYADLSCYGRQEYRTPVLDSLAAQGMKFTHGYANSAVCSSTRVALITGRYQYRLPVGLDEPLSRPGLGLEPEVPTMPSLLKAQGYHTALIGKWHLGALPDYGPLQSGYDEFWGNRGGGVDYYTHGVAPGVSDLWDGDVQIEEAGYYTDMLATRSIEYLDARAAEPDKPWLLSLHFTAPHWPWEANDAAGRSESARLAAIATPGGGRFNIMHSDGGSMETYAAMVTSLDANIGRVLNRVRELGMEQDTVVVFTSDNGGERFSNTWPFSGMKTELLEGGIRVPFIVKWPGLTAPGSSSDTPALSMDFVPTFVAAAGGAADPTYQSDGIDLAPVLMGAPAAERTLFWRYFSHDQKAVRRGRHKYLKINENEYLFDVIADPRERGNLKNRLPDLFADLKQAHADWDAGMLHDPNAMSYSVGPQDAADHYGSAD